MNQKNHKQISYELSSGSCVLVFLFGLVCMLNEHCTASAENNLLTVLGNDYTVNAGEPNTVSNNDDLADTEAVIVQDTELQKESKTPSKQIARTPNTPIQRQLWKAEISASPETASNAHKTELEQLIHQISSIDLNTPTQGAKPEIPVQSAQKTEPNEVILQAEAQSNKMEEEIEKNNDSGISAKTLQRFKELIEHPDTLSNPLALGETLFNSGCLKEAAICYKTALTQIPEDENDPRQDKAWILLQLGNCLKETDPDEALMQYQMIITEYSNSPWAPLAKAKIDTIQWYRQNQPKTLIRELASNSEQ